MFLSASISLNLTVVFFIAIFFIFLKKIINMSEEKTNEFDENEKIEVIKEDSLINLTFSTGYYTRIQALLHYFLSNKSVDQLKTATEKIKNQSFDKESIKDDFAFHYETLLILCKEVEKKAKEQGQMKEMSLKELKDLGAFD